MDGSCTDTTSLLHVKKKIYPGAIDVHPTDTAIIVNYTVQASVLRGEGGHALAGDRKSARKIIHIKAVPTQTNIPALAQDVIQNCKLIHPSRSAEVEQVLFYLLQRQQNDRDACDGGDSDRAWIRKQLDDARGCDTPVDKGIDLSLQKDPPSITNIDTYIEDLYEDTPEKIRATLNILYLAKIPDNMARLVENESLMSALSRVLREDTRKSIHLTTNIIHTFLCFSYYLPFHATITANKIGDMCLRVADLERVRGDVLRGDLERLEERVAVKPNDKALVAQLENEHHRYQSILRSQDKLLFVSFSLLLNLAQDLTIEAKMAKRGITSYLVPMLSRGSADLHLLAVTFLLKVCVFRANVDAVFAVGDQVVLRLIAFMDSTYTPLRNAAFQLIYNLSHDAGFRTLMHTHTVPQKLITMLTTTSTNHHPSALRILYMLTLDTPRTVPKDCIDDVVRLIVRGLLDNPSPHDWKHITAVAVNYACVPVVAMRVVSDAGAVRFIIRRAVKTGDALVFKVVRCLVASCDPEARLCVLDYIDDLMQVLTSPTTPPETTTEILSILASIFTIPNIDHPKIAKTYTLIPILSNLVRAGMQKDDGSLDDVVVEVVGVVACMACDWGSGVRDDLDGVCEVLGILIDVMVAREDDDEMVLQICTCIHQYLLYTQTRTYLITETDVVGYLIDLLYDRNQEIRRVCDAALQIIGETNNDWHTKIVQQKFAWHNAEWISVMTMHHGHQHQGVDEDEHGDTRDAVHSDGTQSDSDVEERGLYRGIGSRNALLVHPDFVHA